MKVFRTGCINTDGKTIVKKNYQITNNENKQFSNQSQQTISRQATNCDREEFIWQYIYELNDRE